MAVVLCNRATAHSKLRSSGMPGRPSVASSESGARRNDACVGELWYGTRTSIHATLRPATVAHFVSSSTLSQVPVVRGPAIGPW